jgi:general secretion pathway protein D
MRQVAVIRILFAALVICAGGAAVAAENASTNVETHANVATGGYATVELAELLDDVGRKSNKQFLLDARVPGRVVVGTVDVKRVSYPQLLTILKNNGCAAVPGPGVVNIVPIANVRTFALPIVNKDDSSIADDEWVTRVIPVNQTEAGQLVPILRPLLPQEAHLAAMTPSRSIVIVDRYANVKRISAIVQELDVAPKKPVSD